MRLRRTNLPVGQSLQDGLRWLLAKPWQASWEDLRKMGQSPGEPPEERRGSSTMRLRRPIPRTLFGSRTADSLQRRMRQRLIRLFTMLMLVLALMQHAANPTNWNWFWRITTPAGQPVHSDATSLSPPRLLFPADDPAGADSFPPILDGELLASLRDDTYFRPEESEAWFRIFAHLRDSPPAELEQSSLGPATYLQLYRQTDFYRGRIVQLHGILRRAHLLTAPANDYAIERYWQCWLFPESSATTPIVVYLLAPPEGFREGMEMAIPVQLQACVYKRWAYARGETMLVAPVVLAANLHVTSATVPASPQVAFPRGPRTVDPTTLVLGCLALAVLGVTAAAIAFRRGTVAARSRPPADLRIRVSQPHDASPESEKQP